MAVLSAKQLKQRETPEFTLDLGGGNEVIVRRPDVQMMVLNGLLSTPMLGDVISLYAEWQSSGEPSADLVNKAIDKREAMLAFIDKFICAVMVKPRVVMTEEERKGDEDVMLASDLTLDTKKAILDGVQVQNKAATAEVVASAQKFPEDGPREGTSSDVQDIQPAPV